MCVCFEFPIVFLKQKKEIYFYFYFLAYNFVLGLCYKKKKESGSFLIFGRSVREFSSVFFKKKRKEMGGNDGKKLIVFQKKAESRLSGRFVFIHVTS